MSTPCTIKCLVRHPVRNGGLTVHLYKHWDGYPEGIAAALIKLINNGRGYIAEKLISNAGCELVQHVDRMDGVQHRYEIEIDAKITRITHHDLWANKTQTMKVEHFIDAHYGRCCPLCGHRPKHDLVIDESAMPRTAVVLCTEHPQFTGKGNSWSLAIARYNQAVMAHIRGESGDA